MAFGEKPRQDNTVRLMISRDAVDEKPKGKYIGDLKKTMQADDGTMQELAEAMVLRDHGRGATACFSPAILRGGIKAEHWSEQQVFAIDIDKDLSFEAALTRCERYGIMPCFVYTTFSCGAAHDKYRMVWCLNIYTQEERIRRAIQAALMHVFDESDISCLNADRMYFGGKELVYCNYEARLDIGRLFDAVYDSTYTRDKAHATRNLKVFCERAGIHMINNTPAVFRADNKVNENGEQSGEPYIIEYPANFSTFDEYSFSLSTARHVSKRGKEYYNVENTDVETTTLIEEVDYAMLYRRCPVFRDFMNGFDIHHDVTWMIATNLMYFEHGEATFFEGLTKRDDYDVQKWQNIFNYNRKRGYGPANYERVVAWYSDVEKVVRAKNLVSLARLKKGNIEVIETKTMKTLVQAEQELQRDFEAALSNQHALSVIKYPTGIGKTQLLMNLEIPALIAVPTHKLKLELYERLRAAGKAVLKTPELPNGLDEEITAHLDKLYRRGNAKAAALYLRELAKKNESIEAYIDELDTVLRTRDVTVITTHARMFFLGTIHQELVIIDEDPLPELLKQDSVELGDLLLLSEKLMHGGFGFKPSEDAKTINNLVQRALQAQEHIIEAFPRHLPAPVSMQVLEKAVLTQEIQSNAIGFFNCKHFVRKDDTIYYIQRRTLPNKKTIMFSATASEFMYRRLVPAACFYTCGDVEIIGKLVQYTNNTYSRSSLNNASDEQMQWISEHLQEDAKRITFKSHKDIFSNVEATYGATAGLDVFSGLDLDIIGTPHLNEVAYILIACALDIDINEDGTGIRMGFKDVYRDGKRFKFQTFAANESLCTIQLDLIEAELVQAVGRARLLRNDCKVQVFSNYPLSGAEYIYN